MSKSMVATAQAAQAVPPIEDQQIFGIHPEPSSSDQQPEKRNKLVAFFSDYIFEPMSGEGCTLNISDDVKARSYFYWEFVLLWEKIILMNVIFYFERAFLQGVVVIIILVMYTLI